MLGETKDVGVVIKTQDYKDADKIVTIITKKHGLLSLFAIGARRQNSKKSPHLDLITEVDILFYGKDFLYLQQASTINSFSKTKLDLKKISLCMSFFEILTQLVPANVEDLELYDSLVVFLKKIEELEDAKECGRLSSKFARYLLRHLGYPEMLPQSLGNISSYFETLMNRKLIAKEMV